MHAYTRRTDRQHGRPRFVQIPRSTALADVKSPVKEIPAVIHLLTQSPPSLQRATIEKYFTPDAAFSHPFCRTWSGLNSRWLVDATYRWYKIMSPRIDLTVQSVAFDEANLTLYVTIFQIFRIWAVPFYYAPIRLTTVLTLRHSPSTGKYLIEKQDDLYQVDQWIRFIAPGGWMLIWIWQAWATLFCVLGTWLLWPVTWVEENWGWGEGIGMESNREMRKAGKKGEIRSDGLTKDESDRASPSEGAQSPSRHRNPTTDDPQYHYDSLQEKEVGVAASGPHIRRRPSRTTSGTKGSPPSSSLSYSEEQNEDDKKNKAARTTLKKLLRRDSHQGELSPVPRSGQEELDEEGSTVGYIPRLGQIREKKTTMQSRRRGSSIVSSTGQPRALRRRHTEDSAAGRSRRQSPTSSIMSAAESDVFKYLQPDNDTENSTPAYLQGFVPSISVPSFLPSPPLNDSNSSDKRPSAAGTDPNGSDISSQTLAQNSSPMVSQLPHQEFRKFKKPLYASSFVHGPRDEDEETVAQSGESEGSCTESEGEAQPSSELSKKSKKITNKVSLPRAPSTSSRGSDLHARRLKQQERELANHILKNPKPQKGFQFNGGTPGQIYPPTPMYSPQVYSGASPSVISNGAANSPQAWSPMHTFPAPLAIGYAPHQSPEAVHAYPHSLVKQIPQPFSPHPAQAQPYQQHGPASTQTKPALTGYELLANELSAPSQGETAREVNLVPVYRKFEHLNHRVLLHLQDEMSELEEELRTLDRCIAQMSPKDPSGHAYPASRRNDARYGGESHFKRTELLGRIFQKLEQYNKALSSFSDMSSKLRPAGEDDVARYREWMNEHEPIDYAESRFLERASDLVAVPRLAAATTSTTATMAAAGEQGAGHHQSAAVWFPFILAVPLLAFTIVPSLLGRLVVIVLIVGMELKIVSSAPEIQRFLSLQEWKAAASV
ncbi:hypothetical protein COCSADRAFT_84215 [Bipolaris sorokiniana ND90Pr]|uniref:Uncharacterized protein n=1 Tax=Cochliobolus sativus (strain ND90Pr / ATCC 201652) TaxID=665912 RepID=M2SG07_COCSN|nr:uncharacterized protein COCSADRAFT_84215 [Bipolaris sorokiniana ND90Pr]EMD66173.1 hypothetical protein COCSADRAFT_84215 [Bipolaris sorokiniana ND90Pr]